MFTRSKDSLPAFTERSRFAPLSVADYLTLFDDVEATAHPRAIFLDAFARAAGMLEVAP